MSDNKKIALGILIVGIVTYFSTKEVPKRTEGKHLAGTPWTNRWVFKHSKAKASYTEDWQV